MRSHLVMRFMIKIHDIYNTEIKVKQRIGKTSKLKLYIIHITLQVHKISPKNFQDQRELLLKEQT